MTNQMRLYPAEDLVEELLRPLHELDAAVDTASSVRAVRDIAYATAARLGPQAPLGDTLFALNDQLFNVAGFHATPSDSAGPQQILLHRVLQQRYAEPLTLGLLYISVGRWLGLPLVGCDFPGRFLVRFQDDQAGVVIDPVAGGVQLQEEELQAQLRRQFGDQVMAESPRAFLSDTDDRHLVLRMLRRLKQAYLQSKEVDRALRVQEKIMQLQPDAPEGFRDRGRIFELLGCARAAAEDYSRYLDLSPDAEDVGTLRQHLSQLLLQPVVLH